MSDQDQAFMRTFTMVLIALAVMGIIIFFIAQNISTEVETSGNTMAEKAVQERIAPVGMVNVGSAAASAGEAGAGSPAGAGRSGKDVIAASCGGCHLAGVAGAPKIGDKAAWAPRFANGMDALLSSVVHGKGIMPPRGGGDFSDDELKGAIKEMLSESGL